MSFTRERLLLLLFAAPLGLAALLLFWLQPMIAKILLPRLGGAPAVWNVAMVFFQAVLLLGYLYATLVSRHISIKKQVIYHAALLLVAFFCLPFALHAGGEEEAYLHPVRWLLHALVLSAGVVALVCAATSPLLQYWFGRSSQRHGENPYFLYAVSNAGSFAGLIGYVLLLEPWLTLDMQARWWSVLFGVFLILQGLCLLAVWRGSYDTSPDRTAFQDKLLPQGVFCTRLVWLMLSFAPSALLLALTQYLTTDIAPLPLLWIVPLALYLLAYVFAFVPRWTGRFGGEFPLVKLLPLQMVLVAPLLIGFYTGMFTHSGSLLILLWHCLAFFVTALVCHRRLYELRPPAAQLTTFYFYLSLGGVLGGMFTALLVPHLFNDTYEYPLLLALALALRPGGFIGLKRDWVWPLGVFIVLAGAAWLGGWLLREQGGDIGLLVTGMLLGLCVLALKACFDLRDRPVALGLTFAAAVFAGIIWHGNRSEVLFRGRNFFGALSVTHQPSDTAGNPGHYALLHGTTVHGIEHRGIPEALSYFSAKGPLGDVFADLRARTPAARIGIIGLGIGSIKCLAGQKDHITYYEINPLVVDLAQDPAFFTLLATCPGTYSVRLGDARLQLQHEGPTAYDLFILDAFNSDAIPVHLLTDEALTLYRAHLAKGGVLALHLSNRYLDLKRVIGSLAAAQGLHAKWRYAEGSLWAVLSEDPKGLAFFAEEKGWQTLPDAGASSRWTDNFSNIITIFRSAEQVNVSDSHTPDKARIATDPGS